MRRYKYTIALAVGAVSDYGHDQVPSDPADGDEFVCSRCGVKQVYVDLDDGQPGEWVDVTPTTPSSTLNGD